MLTEQNNFSLNKSGLTYVSTPNECGESVVPGFHISHWRNGFNLYASIPAEISAKTLDYIIASEVSLISRSGDRVDVNPIVNEFIKNVPNDIREQVAVFNHLEWFMIRAARESIAARNLLLSNSTLLWLKLFSLRAETEDKFGYFENWLTHAAQKELSENQEAILRRILAKGKAKAELNIFNKIDFDSYNDGEIGSVYSLLKNGHSQMPKISNMARIPCSLVGKLRIYDRFIIPPVLLDLINDIASTSSQIQAMLEKVHLMHALVLESPVQKPELLGTFEDITSKEELDNFCTKVITLESSINS